MKLKSVIVIPPSNKRDLFTNCSQSYADSDGKKPDNFVSSMSGLPECCPINSDCSKFKTKKKSKVKKALKKIRKQKTAKQRNGHINW